MDPIFRIDTPPLTHGPGAIAEVGDIATEQKLSRVLLLTDQVMRSHPAAKRAISSLEDAGIQVDCYDEVRVEPTDQSLLAAVDAANSAGFDGFVSLGGGSVIDTAKAANLYSTYPAEFLAYVNAPVGEGRLVPGPLRPHIAIPTTCGTGSEVTGISVFDLRAMKAKTGIMSRHLVPSHAIIDPTAVESLPPLVLASTALDLLCHALEALTCRRSDRRPVPQSAAHRPMTQGANRWSDCVAIDAIRQFQASFEPAAQGDLKARGDLLWAATLAGNAFGNAGCHVPHALSYPVSGMVKDYRPRGYPDDEPMVPHGISVVLNAPSTYRLTGPFDPDRHALAAELLGINMDGIPKIEAGDALADRLIALMRTSGFPSGLEEIGYEVSDLDAMTEAAMPQRRLLDNAPLPLDHRMVRGLFSEALCYW